MLRAAEAALPAGSVTGVSDTAVPSGAGAVSGSVLNTPWGGTVTIVVTDAPADSGSLTTRAAIATKGGVTVLVTADEASDGHLTHQDLAAVAAAVTQAMD